MGKLRELQESELAQALGMLQGDVNRYVSHNEPKADGSGHWVYFKLETPREILGRLKVDKSLIFDLKWRP